jgi:hypothetical protein
MSLAATKSADSGSIGVWQKDQPLSIGVYNDVPFSVYNSLDALRSSQVKMLLEGPPCDLKWKLDNPETSRTPSLLAGEILHAMILEPETIDGRFVFEKEPLIDKTKLVKNGGSKESWDSLKAEAESRKAELVPYDIYSRCLAMAKNVRSHPYFENIEKFARKELTLVAEIEGVLCKVRFDALLYGKTMGGIIFDIKTTREKLTLRNIAKVIIDYNYQLSAAMYVEIGKALGLDIQGFNWIWVENQAPYNVRLTSANPDMLQRGRKEFYEALAVFKRCCETGDWGSYPTEIEEVSLPPWYESRTYPFGAIS